MAQERIEVIFVAKGQRQVERSLVQIAKAADSLQTSAGRAAKSIERMGKTGSGPRAVSKGVQTASRGVQKLGADATKTTGRLNSLFKSLVIPGATGASIRETGRSLNSLVGRFAAFYTGRVLVGISDEFGRMSNVLSGFGVAAGEIDKVRKSINRVANAARVDAVQAATLFGRLRQATKGLGVSSRELVDVVGTVNKALRLGGATSLEASQSIRQLSQAFNKGKLDGDEFRSVMENAPILQDLLTDKLGVTKEALFDLAAQGKITAVDLVGAFQQGATVIDQNFLGQIQTIGDALTVLKNSFREAFGNQVSGPAQILVRAIVSIARNMDGLIRAVSIFAGMKIFQAAIVGAQKLFGLIKAINIQAAGGVLAGLIGGKKKGGMTPGTATANFAAQTAAISAGSRQASGRTMAGGVMAGAKFAGKGLLRAVPYVGWALLIAEAIPSVWDLVKSVTGLGEASKKVGNDLEELDAYVRNKFLEGGGDRSRSLSEATMSQARKAAQLRDPKTYAESQKQKRGVRRYYGVGGVRKPAGTMSATDRSIETAKKNMDAMAKKILRDVKTGEDSLKGFSEVDVKGMAGDLDRLFKLLDAARDIPKDIGIGSAPESPTRLGRLDAARSRLRERSPAARLQGYVEKEFDVKAPDIGRLNITKGPLTPGTLSEMISLFRKYRNAIPFTAQEKLGDSFTETQRTLEKYQARLAEITDKTAVLKNGTTDLATAKGYLMEKIRSIESPLTQENLKLEEQIKQLQGLKSATEQVDKSVDPFAVAGNALTQGQLVALADQTTLQRFLATIKRKSFDLAVKELQANIEKKSLLESLLEPMRKALGIQERQKAAEESIVAILRTKRAEIEAIGKTQAEQNRAAFVDLKPGDKRIREYDVLTLQDSEKRFSTAVESQLKSLQDIAVRIQQIRDTGNLSKDQSQKIETLLNSLREQANQLGATIGESGREGSAQILQEAAEFLKTEAGEAGRILGAALSSAFNNTIRAGIGAGGEAISGGLGGPEYELGSGPASSFNSEQLIQQATAFDTLRTRLDQVENQLSAADAATIRLSNNLAGLGSVSTGPLKQLSSSAKSTANEIQGFFESSFGTLEDALVEFVTTGEFDFKKFINAIIADLARLVIRMLIIKPLMSFFGGLFGFGFASGGLVGTDGTVKKYASGGAVSGSGGTTSDNQLIMASRGEYVLNAAATRRVGASYLDRLNGGGSPSTERRKVGSSTINFAPQITVVNDGGSDKDGQQQGEQIGTMVRQSFIELLMKETRPGGMLESVNRKGFA